MLDLGLVGNGPDNDPRQHRTDRIQKIIDIVGPHCQGGKQIKAGLTPADLSTNEFIDPSIGL